MCVVGEEEEKRLVVLGKELEMVTIGKEEL